MHKSFLNYSKRESRCAERHDKIIKNGKQTRIFREVERQYNSLKYSTNLGIYVMSVLTLNVSAWQPQNLLIFFWDCYCHEEYYLIDSVIKKTCLDWSRKLAPITIQTNDFWFSLFFLCITIFQGLKHFMPSQIFWGLAALICSLIYQQAKSPHVRKILWHFQVPLFVALLADSQYVPASSCYGRVIMYL